jgi:hypothetical protein
MRIREICTSGSAYEVPTTARLTDISIKSQKQHASRMLVFEQTDFQNAIEICETKIVERRSMKV